MSTPTAGDRRPIDRPDGLPASGPTAAQKPHLGLIGFGSFGQFMVRWLSPHFAIRVWDERPLERELKALEPLSGEVVWSTLEQVAECDVVVHAVPVQQLASVLLRLKPLLKPNCLFVDIASVKCRPLELLAEHLPASVDYVGLHPMFGPQSGAGGIAGLKVVLCGGRGEGVGCIREFLSQPLGLEVIEMTAEAHDREMAYIQGLTHWMAKALREIKTPDGQLGTPAYRHLMKIEEILGEDSWDLFLTIQRENPFAKEARQELLQRLNEIDSKIQE